MCRKRNIWPWLISQTMSSTSRCCETATVTSSGRCSLRLASIDCIAERSVEMSVTSTPGRCSVRTLTTCTMLPARWIGTRPRTASRTVSRTFSSVEKTMMPSPDGRALAGAGSPTREGSSSAGALGDGSITSVCVKSSSAAPPGSLRAASVCAGSGSAASTISVASSAAKASADASSEVSAGTGGASLASLAASSTVSFSCCGGQGLVRNRKTSLSLMEPSTASRSA